MRDVLRNRTYRRLFGAQIVALLGTGLLTVALGLLAFDLTGSDAGLVLGTALTIKMLAYVMVSPIMAAITTTLPRKTLLIGTDALRACVALCLPFVTEPWHIYVLIFVLQSASATFTPAFQAVIPDILPDERQYTRALSLTRLAYDLETLVSPVLAAALLTLIGYHFLFIGTAAGFAASAALVLTASLPRRRPAESAPFLTRLTSGTRMFWRSGELRALLALNIVVATGTAMILVNTVVFVQADLQRAPSDLALLLAVYGAGSMSAALMLPRVLDRVGDRSVMLTGGFGLSTGLVGVAGVTALGGHAAWLTAMPAWFALGVMTSSILTPSARLLRRASDEINRPDVFAAQFALSHACFLVTYPLAGLFGAAAGLPATAMTLALIALIAAIAATRPTWSDLHHTPRGHIAD